VKHTFDFTEGPILPKLLRFGLPILGALILQAMYGAVDLMVVGQFAGSADVSAVATGGQLMHTVTAVITGIAMGTTVLLGQRLGEGRKEELGSIVGSAIFLFGVAGVVLTLVLPVFAPLLCRWMHAPEEAFVQTVQYVSVCAGGSLFIVAYNVLGSMFRGIGDSKTPLLAVFIACLVNIVGDLLLVAVFDLAAAGAALATVLAQGLSVLLCVLVIKKRGLPFPFQKRDLRPVREHIQRMLQLGSPIALQNLLVSLSFLVLVAIVNSLGLVASAGVGVAEKLCAFIMLVPSAFSQSLSAFVAQNIGAEKPDRAKRAMLSGMLSSLVLGTVMAYMAFFHGDILASLFAREEAVILAAWDYLRAYAIDTLLVSFLFCFIGYFNGCGNTGFVMLQGLCGAFGVRIPVSFLMSRLPNVTLFRIGLATPSSTIVQILLCVIFLRWRDRNPRTWSHLR